jgi:antitoxin (DNA-binding transcriptional repressor) of toxin-antitoxin stability system
MRQTVTVTTMARNFADYINRVAYRGERFLLTRGNRVVAEIRPVPEARRLSELPGLLGALPRLSPDEAEAFGRDLAENREALGPPPQGGAWES